MRINKIGLVVLVLGWCSLWAAWAESLELTGYLMPVACDKRDPDRGPSHTTVCALEPDCVERGFGLWTAEKLTKFDARGNQLALSYFKSTHRENDHKIRVLGDLVGDVLQVRELVPIE